MKSSPRRVSARGETRNGHGNQLRDLIARRATLELGQTCFTIEELMVRKRILEMMKLIATTLSDE